MQQQYDDNADEVPGFLKKPLQGAPVRGGVTGSLRRRFTRNDDMEPPMPEPQDPPLRGPLLPPVPDHNDFAPQRAEAPPIAPREQKSDFNLDLRRLEKDLTRSKLDEIADLVRALTYGEMMELATAIHKVRPNGGALDEHSLPMTLHLWSSGTKSDDTTAASEAPAAAIN